MTLKELKQRVDTTIEMSKRNEGLNVCIPNNKGGMGGMSVTNVRGANGGIDWDRGKFIIWPEEKVYEATDMEIRESAVALRSKLSAIIYYLEKDKFEDAKGYISAAKKIIKESKF